MSLQVASNERTDIAKGPIDGLLRSTEFWRRATGIYLAYKGAQVRAAGLKVRGWSPDRIKDDFWLPHHEWAGREMYQLCIDLRGFYLKVGQFFGARADFMPEPVCRHLSKLHDQVPPMSAAQTRLVLERELKVNNLGEVFEWIDLDKPLGSASISQVHKGKLRWRNLSNGNAAVLAPAALAAAAAQRDPSGPPGGIVAVKVQYPEALPTMMQDLSNIKVAAAYLSRTELKFDLESPVRELAAQIRLEFDFEREARVMDRVARDLQVMAGRVEVPCSVAGLVTQRVLVMNYVEGLQIMRLGERTAGLSAAAKRAAARRILGNVSEAYGRMLLGSGLFQADGHPGNILVMKGGKVGLLDYGQSKQLPEDVRRGFAELMLALDAGDDEAVGEALGHLGVVTARGDPVMRSRMAYGMFDTRGRVNPFDPDSPIKAMEVKHFPPDLFFVLRVVQLLRGLATGMGVEDFSCATQWAPFAAAALGQERLRQRTRPAVSLGFAPQRRRQLAFC